MYWCESWTVKKAKHWITVRFKLWCWRRLLIVPWTARRSNQSNLVEINSEYSLEGLMLKLKLWYFGHLMWRTDSFEKTLMLGKIEGGMRKGWQRMRWLDGITDSMDMRLSKLQGSLAFWGPLGRKELDTTQWLNNNNGRSRETTASPSVVSFLMWHLILFLLHSPWKETRKIIISLIPQMGKLR